jgi:hypothetical protein
MAAALTTMTSTDTRNSLHFVGSVPLHDAEAVFRTLSSAVGPYTARLPDGETAERSRFIFFQRQMLEDHPDMEVDPTLPEFEMRQWDGALVRSYPLLRFRDGADLETLVFGTGYDQAAEYSYQVFARLQADGVIAPDTRFQVSLPTPMATGYFYISHKARDDYLRVYERSLLRALDRILDVIPNEKLAIQFDVCQEVLVFEGYFEPRPDNYKTQIFDMLGRLGDSVPIGAELGYHLCYGTPAEEHLVMPKDAAVLVELMNGILSGVARPVDYIHLPVPSHCTDDEFFLPFRDYEGSDATKVFVGMIHHDDVAGDKQRIEVAARHIDNLGVASECGWGRAEPATVASLLESHRLAAKTLAGLK